MEENKIAALLDEEIEAALAKLKTMDKGSQEYGALVSHIAKLNEQRLTEMRLNADASNKAFDRAIEDEKMVHEKQLKLEETKQTKLKVWSELGKAGMGLLTTFGGILLIGGYEEFAPMVSKAMQFLPKPKF